MTKTPSILIVDDTPSNIEILSAILKDQYQVISATNGPDALSIVHSDHCPDLILLDIIMPDMDGYEVCKKLKANPETSKIPVIFVTAMGGVEDESRGFKLGCVDYIAQPIRSAIVRARVKTHLELKQALEKLEAQNHELKEASKLREEVERITKHDLKNPLTGVFSGAELMDFDEGLTPNQQDALNTIKKSAKKMLDMINSSLDLFKMEKNIYRLSLVDVDIIRMIHRIEKDLNSLINAKKARIRIMLENSLLHENEQFLVKGENLLIYSMLANLIKNALEASPESESVEISLSIKNGFTEIAIQNQGSVPEEIRHDFFNKYVTKGKWDGTGLGTYSAKLITQTLKGNIAMTSSRAHGTTITISLPY